MTFQKLNGAAKSKSIILNNARTEMNAHTVAAESLTLS